MKNKTFHVRGTRKWIEIYVITKDLELFLSEFKNYIEENKAFFRSGNFQIIGIDAIDGIVDDIEFSNHSIITKLKELEIKYSINITVTTEQKHDPNMLWSRNFTNYHLKTIRSGQSIHYDGDVVIIGDVNSGGEIIATGNITITGNLRGKAHCGYPNNHNCFIIANKMFNTQIRIGEKIALVGSPSLFQRDGKIAYIINGEIKITNISEWQRRGE
ncbi:septum site-determining protein MinC [Anaerobranca californiensis DSM 14826]|jgi:septum site-determining protein MinC|uniref:Probable septum site-determining protein MinC n=1 Tax=Anaerobranca californiensis DSM 14826 TaxID=1120989 RepID=A0A1M6NIV2_9FIRM|nr:septum site-determining protein MinC [Anaerobranca californiensis]SHJ95617.1 septum site-determining protein MinC [Anaerobranca californiensis DSM 14826]